MYFIFYFCLKKGKVTVAMHCARSMFEISNYLLWPLECWRGKETPSFLYIYNRYTTDFIPGKRIQNIWKEKEEKQKPPGLHLSLPFSNPTTTRPYIETVTMFFTPLGYSPSSGLPTSESKSVKWVLALANAEADPRNIPEKNSTVSKTSL